MKLSQLRATLTSVTDSERATTELSSFAQGIALIDAVVRRERSGRSGYSSSQLAEETRIERSRVSRLTQELLEMRLLEKLSDGTLRVGPAYFALGASRQDDWLRESRQELRRLASSERASVRVLAPDGSRAVLLRFESGPGAPDSAVRAGMVTPIWSTGGGRALLWCREREEILELLAGSLFVGVGGPNAARSPAGVADRLEQDRGAGYVEAVEEFEYGVVEIASPVIVENEVIASITAACHVTDDRARARLRHEVPSLAGLLVSVAEGPVKSTDSRG